MLPSVRLALAVLLLAGASVHTLHGQALAIRTTEMPQAIKGVPYQTPISTYTNGRCPLGDVALTLAAGRLPRGMELFTDGLHGTPEEIGTFPFAIRASNNCLHVTRNLELIVGGKPLFFVTPTQVGFQYREGSAELPHDLVQIEASLPDMPYAFEISSTAPWLRAEPSLGRTPDRTSTLTGDRVRLTIDPAGLAPGRYSGSIRFYARGGENAPVLPVTLEVTKRE